MFGNRERLLPKRSRGYYREYTVKTPGAKDRGARRIVAGSAGRVLLHRRSLSQLQADHRMSGKLLQRLQDPSRSGVYRVSRADGDRGGGEGLAAFPLVRCNSPTRSQLLKNLAAALGFPDWFGDNWDALEDCLTDLSWREAPAYVLLIEDAKPGDDLGVLIDILRSSAESWAGRGKPFFAVFVDPGRALVAAGAFQTILKLPLSVLVVVHTAEMEVLLLERAQRPGFWQSVTGSLDPPDEAFEDAAARELQRGDRHRRRRRPLETLERGLYLRDLCRSGATASHPA